MENQDECPIEEHLECNERSPMFINNFFVPPYIMMRKTTEINQRKRIINHEEKVSKHFLFESNFFKRKNFCEDIQIYAW